MRRDQGPGLAGCGCSARAVRGSVPLVEVSKEEEPIDLLDLPRSLTCADPTHVGSQVCRLAARQPSQHQQPMRGSRRRARRGSGWWGRWSGLPTASGRRSWLREVVDSGNEPEELLRHDW